MNIAAYTDHLIKVKTMFSPPADDSLGSPKSPSSVIYSASTRSEFEKLLQLEHGLDPSFDPRIRQALNERLGNKTVLDDGDIRAFMKSSTLLSRALRGRLIIPSFKQFSDSMDEAFDEAILARSEDAVNEGLGLNAQYIPPLRDVDPDQRIVCACTIDGQLYSRYDGNCSEDTSFTVQSVSKVVTYAIALESSGEKLVHEEVGREPSGRSFNELTLTPAGKPHNPYINSGAIRTSALVFSNLSQAEKFESVCKIWSELCLETIGFDNELFLAERETADKNFCLAYMMRESKSLPADYDVEKLVSLYLSFCSLKTNCRALSVAAATLANGGLNPFTGKRIFSERTVRNCLSLMASCGMYDGSGSFQLRIGIPAKSGVSGVLLCVVPWRFGFATFSPRLDRSGNSVFGVEFCRALVPKLEQQNLGLPLFRYNPGVPPLNSRKLQTLFLHACARGDLVRVRELVARGCPFQRSDYDGRTGLHVCPEHAESTRNFLLKIGLDPLAEDRFGNLAAPGCIPDSSSEDEVPSRPSNLGLRLTSREKMMDLYFLDPRAVLPKLETNLDALTASLEGASRSIPSRLERVGLSPARFYDISQRLDQQLPQVSKALAGCLAIPDWANFATTFSQMCDEVQRMPNDKSPAQYCHILSTANVTDFAAAVTSVDGQVLVGGNAPHKKVSLQSVFKPFAYAIALENLGFENVERKVSCEPSGRSFRDMSLDSRGRPYNPMVNAGGLVTSSLIFPDVVSQADRYAKFVEVLQKCSGQNECFEFSQGVYLGEMEGAYNRVMAIAHVLRGSGAISDNESLEKAVEFYFALCSIMIDVRQASALAACLANGGRNPFTGEQLFSEEVTRRVIIVMLSSGLAEYSGTHSFTCGFPAKSGVSGLTIGVINGICGFAVASAGLDEYGNSAKGNIFFQMLAEKFRVHLFEMDSLSTRYSNGTPLNRYQNEIHELMIGDLLFAASRGDIWLVKELLARKVVEIDACDYDGRTALHLAASEGRIEIAKILLEFGANPGVKDRFGGTPKDDAVKFQHFDIVQLFERLEVNEPYAMSFLTGS